MTLFEQFITTYFISAAAIAGLAVIWRNWLEDHAPWKAQLHGRLGTIGHAFTCGSCFTYWESLFFILIFDPLGAFLRILPPFIGTPGIVLYFVQWMALGWGAVFLRFAYVALQESVSIMAHRHARRHGNPAPH